MHRPHQPVYEPCTGHTGCTSLNIQTYWLSSLPKFDNRSSTLKSNEITRVYLSLSMLTGNVLQTNADTNCPYRKQLELASGNDELTSDPYRCLLPREGFQRGWLFLFSFFCFFYSCFLKDRKQCFLFFFKFFVFLFLFYDRNQCMVFNQWHCL